MAKANTVAVRGSTLTATGEIDWGSKDELVAALQALAVSGEEVVVDLRGVTFMDSSAIASVVAARRSALEHGGSLVVLASDVVHRTLTVLALDKILGLSPEQ
jgi:anti-sigma B factor antagonist